MMNPINENLVCSFKIKVYIPGVFFFTGKQQEEVRALETSIV